MRTRWRRRAPIACATIIVLLVAAAGAGYPVYVSPPTAELRPADAVLVLGGPGDGRYEYGVDLVERGLAPELVLSDPHDLAGTPGSMCAPPAGGRYRVTCFPPEPATTKGEIAAARRLTADHDWDSIIVVTFTPHVARTRYLFDRCYPGTATVVADPAPIGVFQTAWQYIYQTAGFARAFVQRDC